jgi:ABC-type uncharacterized transport system ATPase subunit
MLLFLDEPMLGLDVAVVFHVMKCCAPAVHSQEPVRMAAFVLAPGA